MDKKIEAKSEKKEEVKPARIKIRKLPDRPLGLIQGT